MNKEEHTLPEGYYNSQYHTYLHYTEDSFMDCNPKSYKYILQLEEQIENLQKKAELGEHYKHLYSEVKKQKDELEKENNELQKAYELIDKSMYELMKQKDDVVEYIKSNCIVSDEWTELDFCNFVPTGKVNYKALNKEKVKDLLRMLGEIDENN